MKNIRDLDYLDYDQYCDELGCRKIAYIEIQGRKLCKRHYAIFIEEEGMLVGDSP